MPTFEEKKAIFQPGAGSVEGDAIKMKNDSVHTEHYCEHPGCKKWGGWGFQSPPRTGVTHWYCGEHRTVGAHAF